MQKTTALSRRSFIAMSAVALATAACQRNVASLKLNGSTMGTTYNVVAVDHSRSVDQDALKSAVEASLAKVNTQMSNWDAGSEISRVNALPVGETLALSPELADVLNAAATVNKASDGQFDVTVGPLIDAWGFGAKGAADMPSEAAITAALATVGQDKLALTADSITKSAEAEIYLSAIGKGFGVDQVARAVEAFGITDYMVEIGGDLRTSGKNPDGLAWQIGIETPELGARELAQVVEASGFGMATSGDYRNFFEADGQRYSHILDSKTGRPVTHSTASVTVLTENAMLADAWATAMLVLGTERGLEIGNEQNMAVLFIDRAGEGFASTPSAAFAKLSA